MVQQNDPARICADLVRIRSENPPGDTRDVIGYIRDFTDACGIRTRVVRSRGRRHNLVSETRGRELLFCGHVDVVPAIPHSWLHDPFSGTIADGKVWGRGSTDMKGGCASVLSACRAFVDSGRELPAALAFVCDEETSGTYGIRTLLARGLLLPCDTVIAEPTPARYPNIGQKGLVRLCCRFRGTPGHGSLYPARGVSAVMEAFALLEFLKELHARRYTPDDPALAGILEGSSRVLEEIFGLQSAGDILNRIMFNPGTIEGGEKANIVAEQCSLGLDIRVPWGCSLPDLIREIRERAVNAEITVANMSEPSLTDPGSRLVTRLVREIRRVYGTPARPIVQWAASDARYLRREGFRVAEYGPGEIHALHAVDEYVTIESLEQVARVYEGLLSTYGAEDRG